MTAYSKQLIIFDKDDTLTPSKGVMDAEMAELLARLLERKKVAIISGSGFPLFDIQVLHALPHNIPNISNLIILPVSGTQLYTWKGSWVAEYTEHLSLKEKEKIMVAINTALKQVRYEAPSKIYGDLIEDRGSQITFSALGQNAPLEAKKSWDPDRTKRNAIADFLISRIPEFDIRLGGTTSIDITKRGVNKGYGIRKLEEYLKIPLENMVFVGDALFRGGNDYPAKATGIDCIQVSGPEETKKLIASWLVD